MRLNNYILNGPSVVILDDKRDPYVSWEHHLERTANDVGGPRGGVDLVANVGTPVYAPTDGTVTRLPNNGGAGNSMEFWHDLNPGWRDVFSHLSSYAVSPRGNNEYRQGEVIAYTGDSGGVAPHLHRHLLDPNNRRQNPWDYFSGTATKEGDEDMEPFISVSPKGAWFLICRNQNGLYASPLGKNDKVTGDVKKVTWADDYGYSTFKSGIFNAISVGM